MICGLVDGKFLLLLQLRVGLLYTHFYTNISMPCYIREGKGKTQGVG